MPWRQSMTLLCVHVCACVQSHRKAQLLQGVVDKLCDELTNGINDGSITYKMAVKRITETSDVRYLPTVTLRVVVL